MKRQDFRNLFEQKIVILDGATGTEMQKRGMPAGVCPEVWAMEHPEVLMEVQRAYADAGSDIVYTFTFGGSAHKLSEYRVGERVTEINRRLAEITREAVAGKALVAGDIAPCGLMLEPYGDASFEDVVDGFRAQVRGLLDGGVDLFAIETMMDLQEARAALLAVRELSDLPVLVTMTYEGGRTLTGTDPLSALVTLQSLGADAVGCNCSLGPVEMADILKTMKPYAKVPLIAKPNAGKPKLVEGKTRFSMDVEAFSAHVQELVDAGANAVGGCCGTNPEYIARMAAICKGQKAITVVRDTASLVCSSRRTVRFGHGLPLAVIGERLNPTGKKKLKEALLTGDMDLVHELAQDQMEEGADLLDVNAGVPGIDEAAVLKEMVQTITQAVPLPLCLDSTKPEALEAALRIYPGRAIINSISAETVKLERILPIAAKYGAMFVLLPLDDQGVPATAEDRIRVAQRVMEAASAYGFTAEDVLVDGITMTVASNPEAAGETLRMLRWSRDVLGANTILGLSNISFGLPAREWVNAAFFAMAVGNGLTTAILNPANEILRHIRHASDLLVMNDEDSRRFLAAYADAPKAGADAIAPEEKKFGKESNPYRTGDPLFDAVVTGARDGVLPLVRQALADGKQPSDIVEGQLIPAISRVGDLYEQRKYFLPQLIQGAETMQKAMAVLEPLIAEQAGGRKRGTIVIATVKGDIHDIGKNIVALMLKNTGFDVVDLGKDVDAELIVSAAREHDADIVALSALMTTTMTEMPKVAARLREAGLRAKLMVGGAVVDEVYAASFGATYTSDAYMAARTAETLS